MKILNLSLDKSALDKNSALAKRLLVYGQLADKYWLIAAGGGRKIVDLSDRVRVFGAGGAGKLFKLINAYFLGKKILKDSKFDLITVQDPYYLAFIGLRLSRKFGLGFELQIHGWEKFGGLRAWLAKYVARRAGAVRVVSQRLKKQLIEDFGVSEQKIIVVPIFTETREQARDESPKPDFIFLTVSRLVPVKNIKMQISVMAEIVREHKNAKLWIVGDGPERENLSCQVAKLGLAESVKFFGQQASLAEYFKKADAFLLTSNYEGWGLVVVEAAGFGLPIIMTDVGCAQELIKDQESGLIIPIGGQLELENAMKKILSNANLRNKLSQGARAAIKRLASQEETLRLYQKSWELALSNKL